MSYTTELNCVSSARSEAQVMYYMWKLLYSHIFRSDLLCQFIKKLWFCFLWHFGWKQCLFANVLCDIPVLCTSYIHNGCMDTRLVEGKIFSIWHCWIKSYGFRMCKWMTYFLLVYCLFKLIVLRNKNWCMCM